MAIYLPIVTQFNNKGITDAEKGFKDLKTNGERAHFALKKAALPAAAALTAVAGALGAAVKGAIEDAAAQDKLAQQIKRTTGATDQQIKANEDWITVQGKSLGFSDDQLRPALSRLVVATGSVTEAQKLASAAMDLAAGKGISLETASKALEKAYGGNLTALAKLSPELRQMIKDGASLDEVMGAMSKTFGGAASAAAETTAGKFKRLGVALSETKESIGAALMPAVEAVLPILQKFGAWAQDNPKAFLIIGGAIAGIAVAITAINFAMALNPFTAIALGIGLLVAGIAIAYTKFEGFRNLVKFVVNGISDYFEFMVNSWIKVINLVITGINLVKPGKGISTLGSVSFGHIGESNGGGNTGSIRGFESPTSSVASSAPTPIASAPVPIATAGGGGGGKAPNVNYAPPTYKNEGDTSGGVLMGGMPDIIINAGLISTPDQIGQDIIAAIQAAQRRSGQVFADATGVAA